MIKYVLVENSFTKNENKFVALISDSQTKTMDDIIDHMVSEGTGMTRPQTLAYFEKLKEVIRFYLEQGYSVNTPLVRFRPSIRGTFHDLSDRFDPERHKLVMRAVAGSYIKEIEAVAKPVYGRTDYHIPHPIALIDVATDRPSTSIPSGSIGKLKGDYLSFEPTDNQQGIFLVPVEKTQEVLRISTYSLISGTEIHFLLPYTLNGKYSVEVRTLDRVQKNINKGLLSSKINFVGR